VEFVDRFVRHPGHDERVPAAVADSP
jgi:hypothetical protein